MLEIKHKTSIISKIILTFIFFLSNNTIISYLLMLNCKNYTGIFASLTGSYTYKTLIILLNSRFLCVLLGRYDNVVSLFQSGQLFYKEHYGLKE